MMKKLKRLVAALCAGIMLAWGCGLMRAPVVVSAASDSDVLEEAQTVGCFNYINDHCSENYKFDSILNAVNNETNSNSYLDEGKSIINKNGVASIKAEVSKTLTYERLKLSVHLMEEVNQLRANSDNYQGAVDPLEISYDDMMFSALSTYFNSQAGYSYGHLLVLGLSSYPLAENVAWGYYDPVQAWYSEKEDYDNLKSNNPDYLNTSEGYMKVGHYLNLANSNYGSAGITMNENGTSAMDMSWSDNNSVPVEEFNQGLDNVIQTYLAQGIKNGTVHTGWLQCNGYWYYVNADGSLAFGWQPVNGKWYYMDVAGRMLTGWQQANNGDWYDFTSSGAMATGWVYDDGSWYYMSPGGVMLTGWQAINGSWYYFTGGGAMAAGWQNINNAWYYMSGSGAMATGWTYAGDNWYYMNANGVMQTGWQAIKGKWYYFIPSSGAMAHKEYINGYWFSADGSWTYPHLASWNKTNGRWWYGDNTGWYAKNQTLRIDGKAYKFNKKGYLR